MYAQRRILSVVLAAGIAAALTTVAVARQRSGLRPATDSTRSAVGWEIVVPYGTAFSYERIVVRRVIDGDTLVLANGERLRLIGVDAPDRVSPSKRRASRRDPEKDKRRQAAYKTATDFVRALVLRKPVSVTFDAERRDTHGRLLGYAAVLDIPTVWQHSPPEGYVISGPPEAPVLLLNATLLASGFARPMPIAPNLTHAALFKELYDQARAQKRGLWAEPE